MALSKQFHLKIGDSSIHNKGVFAGKTFNVGDLILSESPLLICNYTSNKQSFDLKHLSKTIESTPNNIIELIKTLYCPTNKSMFAEKAQLLIQQYQSNINTHSLPLLTKILTILFVNGLTIRIKNNNQNDIPIGSGLFYTVSHINHSCLPNAEWCTIQTNNEIKIVLKAVQHIGKDDEIFISYFSHTHTFRDKMYRQSYLKNGWNFVCKCLRCQNDIDDVRRFKSDENQTGYYCARNSDFESKVNDKKILAEQKFIKSKLWNDINKCDLSKYGNENKQLELIQKVISELKGSGLHSSHYLFLELSYPLAALSNNKELICSVLLNRSVLMKELIKQPNVRLLENEIEIIEFLKGDAKYLKIYLEHIRCAIKLSYILYPKDEHECIEYLKHLLLETESVFIKNSIFFEYECNVCVICQKEEMKLRCAKCQKAYYCAVMHQKLHWKIHKKICKQLRVVEK